MNIINWIAGCVLLMLCIGCKSDVSRSTGDVVILTPQAFEIRIKKLKNKAPLVDVRTAEEYVEGAIPNAINIDYYEDDFEDKLLALDTTKPVLVYCKSGFRSHKAAKILLSKGFKEIYELEGGIMGWGDHKLPIK